jgi:hypothetical protein
LPRRRGRGIRGQRGVGEAEVGRRKKVEGSRATPITWKSFRGPTPIARAGVPSSYKIRHAIMMVSLAEQLQQPGLRWIFVVVRCDCRSHHTIIIDAIPYDSTVVVAIADVI